MAEFNITLPEGRIVQGHPVDRQPVMDEKGKQVIENGEGKTQTFFATAIPKGQEQSWKQTEWGAQIVLAAKDPEHGYPNGEYESPTFSWKVEDGDSNIPNKNGIKNCDREGFPGHWIVKCSTNFDVPCYPADNIVDDARYTAFTKAQNPEEYPKVGDYIRVALRVRGNKPAKSPGVYMNPIATIKTRSGVAISTGGAPASASEVAGLFGATPTPSAHPATPAPSAPSTPPAPPAPPAPAAPPAPPAPAHDLVTPPTMWTYGGQTLSENDWITQGWTIEQLQEFATKS